jgi:hypothetical protein
MAPKKRASSAAPAGEASKAVVAAPAAAKPAHAGPPGAAARLSAWFKSFSFADQIALVWFALDAMTHLTMEANFLYYATVKGGASAHLNDPFARIWNLYGRADTRWAEAWEPATVSVEFPTVFLAGFGAVAILYGIATHAPWRHLAVVVISTLELIGGWYTFAPSVFDDIRNPSKPSALAGCYNADGSYKFVEFWIFIVFMNCLWVVVPAVLLWDSGKRIVAACGAAGTEAAPSPTNANAWWACVVYLVAYAVAVPAVLYLVA